jgi:hypothetical protein
MDNKSPWKGLAYGGFASMLADVITLPIDVTKVRLQVQGQLGAVRQYNGFFDAIGKIVKTEGTLALWKGLSPALLRQGTYGSLRYGLYGPIKAALGMDGTKNDPMHLKIAAGAAAGAASSAICNPTDLIKIRLQADGMGGPGVAPRYRGLIHAFSSIIKEEGVTGLWKGVGPTVGRATVLAAAELSSYDEIKQQILRRQWVEEGLKCHFAAAGSAGFIAAWCSSPFDVIKSRYMNQPIDKLTGKGTLYKGMIDAFSQSVKAEGVTCLWNGFWPNAGRVVPRVVIIFMVMEQLKTRFG